MYRSKHKAKERSVVPTMTQKGDGINGICAIVRNGAQTTSKSEATSSNILNPKEITRNPQNSFNLNFTRATPPHVARSMASTMPSSRLLRTGGNTVNSRQTRYITSQAAATTKHDGKLTIHVNVAHVIADSKGMELLCKRIEERISHKLTQVAKLRATYGNVKLGDITVSQVLGGMRDMIAINCETSQLDPNCGITYRGLTMQEVLERLPAHTQGSKCPNAESVLWLLLTGQIPSEKEMEMLSKDIGRRAKVQEHVYKVIDQLPNETHPMTQYIVAVTAMQTESVFSKAYKNKSYNKETSWKLILEDALNLIAKNALIVGYIYRRSFVDKTIKDGKGMIYNPNEDYAANVARLVGIDTPEFKDLMRLYITAHADHEGGNVSAHSALLIGSALSDPYLSFAGALAGLSGPLHGLANQECLSWVENMTRELRGQDINVETVTKFAQETLKKGQVIPGYGHAVLRVVDPRHTAFLEFAHKRFPSDPLIKILDVCMEAIPPVLAATGKVKSPHPNVDCSTGIILAHFGIKTPEIYTVFFGMSRALGVLAQLVWARALRMPIERPKSHTLDHLEEKCK
ncbi:citrate synthase [Babesia divergens]|uniref:Citrate synthase n=1 Tax=Babesia divergens TaxID=32595 RepID=A0AAD9GJU4_BABDI|nr:citrate synthase [Babesia divergens]